MHVRKLSALALVLGVLAGAAAARDDTVDSELKGLQGTWTITRFVLEGREDAGSGQTLVVSAERYALRNNSKDLETGTFRIDPAKSPRTFDFTPQDGPDRGKTTPGIYELKGDALRVARNLDGKTRPADFGGKGVVVYVCKRA